MKSGLTTRGIRAGGFGLLLALILCANLSAPAMAVPQQPHQFWGNVTICGTQVAAGTEVKATIDEVPGMERTTTVDAFGRYGYSPLFKIPANDPDTPAIEGGKNGDTVRFFVLGKPAGVAVFQIGGPIPAAPFDLNVIAVDLTVTSIGCCPITVGALGTVPAGGTDTFADIACGTDIELTAEESLCCVFDGWEVDGNPVAGNPIIVNMNNFHTAVATCQVPEYTLITNVNPPGVGTVTGAGTYNCCTDVPVEATATDPDYYFDHWSGDLSGDINPTSIHIDANKTITANFLTGEFYTLTVNIVGSGSVTKNPDQLTYPPGTPVQLMAIPADDWTFIGWSGDLGGNTNPANIVMNSNKTVTANFAPEGATYTLTVNILGSGTVTKVPNQTAYNPGAVVQLTAVPAAGWTFAGWNGDLSGNTNPANITMNSNKTVTATFAVWIVELGEGWNTISTPISLDPSCNTWGEFKTFAGLDSEIAYWYDGTFHIVGADYPFVPCDAILVRLASPGVAPFVPSSAVTAPPSKSLGSGWNLIGSAFLNETGELAVNEALISLYYAAGALLPWGYTQVISPAYNQPSWVYIRDGSVQYMLIGKGYWVWMINAGEYAGQTSTPWNP